MKRIVKNLFQIKKNGVYGCVINVPFVFIQEKEKTKMIHAHFLQNENIKTIFSKNIKIYEFTDNKSLEVWVSEELKKGNDRLTKK